MDLELTALSNLPVYTPKGVRVGVVQNVLVDLQHRKVVSLLVTRTNPSLVAGGKNVAIPYRWVAAVGEVILLSTFPAKVTGPTPGRQATATAA